MTIEPEPQPEPEPPAPARLRHFCTPTSPPNIFGKLLKSLLYAYILTKSLPYAAFFEMKFQEILKSLPSAYIGAHGRDFCAHGRDLGAHERDLGAHGRDLGAHGRDLGAHGRDARAHGRALGT